MEGWMKGLRLPTLADIDFELTEPLPQATDPAILGFVRGDDSDTPSSDEAFPEVLFNEDVIKASLEISGLDATPDNIAEAHREALRDLEENDDDDDVDADEVAQEYSYLRARLVGAQGTVQELEGWLRNDPANANEQDAIKEVIAALEDQIDVPWRCVKKQLDAIKSKWDERKREVIKQDAAKALELGMERIARHTERQVFCYIFG
jgi:hypothetical protein